MVFFQNSCAKFIQSGCNMDRALPIAVCMSQMLGVDDIQKYHDYDSLAQCSLANEDLVLVVVTKALLDHQLVELIPDQLQARCVITR